MNSYQSYRLRRLQPKTPRARVNDMIDVLWGRARRGRQALCLRNENILYGSSHFLNQTA
jgi:hypothetical protein